MLLANRNPPSTDIALSPLATGEKRVRGFLCGTTNPLLAQNTRLAEVIVSTLPFPSVEKSAEVEAPAEGAVDSYTEGDVELVEPPPRRSNGVLSRLLVSATWRSPQLFLLESPWNPNSSVSALTRDGKSAARSSHTPSASYSTQSPGSCLHRSPSEHRRVVVLGPKCSQDRINNG